MAGNWLHLVPLPLQDSYNSDSEPESDSDTESEVTNMLDSSDERDSNHKNNLRNEFLAVLKFSRTLKTGVGAYIVILNRSQRLVTKSLILTLLLLIIM